MLTKRNNNDNNFLKMLPSSTESDLASNRHEWGYLREDSGQVQG